MLFRATGFILANRQRCGYFYSAVHIHGAVRFSDRAGPIHLPPSRREVDAFLVHPFGLHFSKVRTAQDSLQSCSIVRVHRHWACDVNTSSCVVNRCYRPQLPVLSCTLCTLYARDRTKGAEASRRSDGSLD